MMIAKNHGEAHRVISAALEGRTIRPGQPFFFEYGKASVAVGPNTKVTDQSEFWARFSGGAVESLGVWVLKPYLEKLGITDQFGRLTFVTRSDDSELATTDTVLERGERIRELLSPGNRGRLTTPWRKKSDDAERYRSDVSKAITRLLAQLGVTLSSPDESLPTLVEFVGGSESWSAFEEIVQDLAAFREGLDRSTRAPGRLFGTDVIDQFREQSLSRRAFVTRRLYSWLEENDDKWKGPSVQKHPQPSKFAHERYLAVFDRKLELAA